MKKDKKDNPKIIDAEAELTRILKEEIEKEMIKEHGADKYEEMQIAEFNAMKEAMLKSDFLTEEQKEKLRNAQYKKKNNNNEK